MKPVLLLVAAIVLNVNILSQSYKVEISSLPSLKKSTAGNLQQIGVLIENADEVVKGKVTFGDHVKDFSLNAKEKAFLLFDVPEVKKSRTAQVKIVTQAETLNKQVTIIPVKKWKVNLVQHTHTDIGYTRSQTEILAEELRYIDYALDYCDATDNYPDEAKFRWTCEASMPVSEYLKVRPKEQIDRLKKRVQEGRIELTGMYFNFDELPDEQMYAASLYPLQQMKNEGLKCQVAMQNDVNGIGWCFNEYFPDMGIRYFSIGSNSDRALIPFDKPTVFWWESPSGKRMMVHRAEHYHTGNFWGIHKNDFEAFEQRILKYLKELEGKNYPYDLVSIQYSGYHTDNSPPSTQGPEMIRLWNAKYEWPKLRSAITAEFFSEIEQRYGNALPVIKAAWPDWWTDGFGSGALEAAVTRIAQGNTIANQTGLAMAKLLGAQLPADINQQLQDLNKALLFYGEHTFGYHASIWDPYGLHTMEQRLLKASYAWEAYRRSSPIGEIALGLLQMYVPRSDVPSVAVFNPHNWTYNGIAKVYIDHQMLPKNIEFEITNEQGKAIPAQPSESQADGTYWNLWVEDVPVFGLKQYYIRVKETEAPKAEPVGKLENTVIENQWYKITLNAQLGAISRWYDKDLKVELLTPGAEWQMGQFIYELADSRRAMSKHSMPDFTRKGVDEIAFESFNKGSIWDTWRFRGNTSAGIGEKNFMFELRVFKTAKRIDLVYRLRKKGVTDPEAVYIAFPFELAGGKTYFDVQGGVMQAGVDQIVGSVNDWNIVQNFATVQNASSQIILTSQEIPLMQFGAINTGRYKAGALPESNNIYSWPMNNYWTTNFNAYQEGEMEWTYHLTSSDDRSLALATKFGWDNRVPILVRILPAGKSSATAGLKGSVLSIEPRNLLLISARPVDNENAIVLQLREISGLDATFKASSAVLPDIRYTECDVLGNSTGTKTTPVTFKPKESKFIKIEW